MKRSSASPSRPKSSRPYSLIAERGIGPTAMPIWRSVVRSLKASWRYAKGGIKLGPLVILRRRLLALSDHQVPDLALPAPLVVIAEQRSQFFASSSTSAAC